MCEPDFDGYYAAIVEEKLAGTDEMIQHDKWIKDCFPDEWEERQRAKEFAEMCAANPATYWSCLGAGANLLPYAVIQNLNRHERKLGRPLNPEEGQILAANYYAEAPYIPFIIRHHDNPPF